MARNRSMMWYGIGFLALVISTFFLTRITVFAFNSGRAEIRNFPESFFRPSGERLIFAHRGLTQSTVENTLTSFEASRALGVDVLETDVQLTSDGVVVIFHDDTLERMAGRSESIAALTLKEVQSLAIPAGCEKCEQIPTLEEFLVRFPAMPVNIELKNDSKVLAREVARILAPRQDRKDVIVGSAHKEAIQEFRRQSSLPTSANTGEVIHASICYLLDARCEFDFQALQLPFRPDSLLPALRGDAEFLDWAHNRGLRVDYWTINEEADMKTLLGLPVDGIMTDVPSLALKLRAAVAGAGPGTDKVR
ncbi:MAG: hypothetical protein KDK25_02440 [Leptospiraceae bacterium]|nr:hypothetical protein [Leptospiraceae bacterium]